MQIEASAKEAGVYRIVVAPPSPTNAPIAAVALEAGGFSLHIAAENGHIAVRGSPTDPGERWGGQVSRLATFGRAAVAGLDITWRASPGEHIYGLGERFDSFDQAGRRVEMWIKDVPGAGGAGADSYFCTPVLYSSRNYALFAADNPEGEFDFNSLGDGWNHYRRAGESATFYVAVGENLDDLILKRGRVQGPFRGIPDWAWGPWISRNSFETQAEAEAAIRGHLSRGWPVAAIVQEAWKGPAETGEFNNFFAPRWPNLDGYFALCAANDIRTALWQVPVVHPRSPGFAEEQAQGYFVRGADGAPSLRSEWLSGFANVDFTNRAAARWWAEQLGDEVRRGVRAIKADDGESIRATDVFSDGRHGWQVHNEYAALYNQALADFLASETTDGMLWARSGSLGIERAPGLWAGDQFARWEQLRSLIPAGLSASISGMPFWGHDIGGYDGTPTPDLYIRWLQFGAFSPLMQYHGRTPREPWVFGRDAEAAYDKLVHIRMCLRPTLIALGKAAAETGMPIMRPVKPAPRGNTLESTEMDTYMLGPDLLVAPVLAPGRTGRNVCFPPGRWHQLVEPVAYDGGVARPVLIGFDGVPVFVREGTELRVAGDVVGGTWRWRKDAGERTLAYSAERAVVRNLAAPLVADALRGEAVVRFESVSDAAAKFSAMVTRPGELDTWEAAQVATEGIQHSLVMRGAGGAHLQGAEQGFRIWAGEVAAGPPLYAGRIRWDLPIRLEAGVPERAAVEQGRQAINLKLTNATDAPVAVRYEVAPPDGASVTDGSNWEGQLAAFEVVRRPCTLELPPTTEAASRLAIVKALSGEQVICEKKVAFSPPWRWVVVGPFTASRRAAHRVFFGPEYEHGADVVFDAPEGARWEQVPRGHVVAHGGLNFGELYGLQTRVAAYALTRLRADRDCDAELRLGSDDTFAIWLNDEPAANQEVYRAAAPDQDTVPVHLRAGQNVLVIKVAQDSGDWKLFVRLTGKGDTALVGVHDGFEDFDAYRGDRPSATRHVAAARPLAWQVAGPMERNSANAEAASIVARMGSDAAWPPAGATWQTCTPPAGGDGTIDLAALLGQHCNKMALAALEFDAAEGKAIEVVCGSDDGLRLWLNGKLLVDDDRSQQFHFDAHRVRAEVRAGRNRVLACISQECGDWMFRAEMLDLTQHPPRPLRIEDARERADREPQ